MKQFFKENWWLFLIVLAFLVFVTFTIRSIRSDWKKGDETRNYYGAIIDKGYDPPSSGHKSHTDAQYWIILMDEDIHTAIRVNVTPGCFYAKDKGARVCFTISAREMEHYGNTNDYEHLK
jgi:hypothetical protein